MTLPPILSSGRWWGLTALTALAGISAIVSLFWPLGWDQGVYAWVGSTLASGGMPFRDAWDIKGPVTYIPFSLVAATVGPEGWAFRLVDLVFLAGGSLAVFAVARRLGYQSAAPFAAAGLFLAQPSFGFWSTLQPDHWAGWLLTAAAALTLGATAGSHERWLVAGVPVGIAALIKPHYGAALLVPLIGAWSLGQAERGKRTVAVLAGATIPVAACLAWFWSRGALPELIDGYLMFPAEAVRLDHESIWRTPRQGLRAGSRSLAFALPLVPVALVGLLRLWRTNVRPALLVSTWLVLLLAGVVAQQRWFIYHWAPVTPPLLVLGCIGIAALCAPPGATDSRVPAGARRGAAAVAVLLSLTLAVKPLLVETKAVSGLVLGRSARADFLERYHRPAVDYWAADIELAAREVARLTTSGDCTLVWSDPFVNVLSARPTPSRFATFVGLTRNPLTPRRRRYREEFLDALASRPPRLILVDTIALSLNARFQGNITIRFPAFYEGLRARYDSLGLVGKYAAWQSQAASPGSCR